MQTGPEIRPCFIISDHQNVFRYRSLFIIISDHQNVFRYRSLFTYGFSCLPLCV